MDQRITFGRFKEITFKKRRAAIDHIISRTVIAKQIVPIANLFRRSHIDVDIGTLETVNGLLGIPHHKYGMLGNHFEFRIRIVVIRQKYFAENIPLQLVRILELIDNRKLILGTEPGLQQVIR